MSKPGFRAAAKAAGQPRYSTGAPCKNGHLADRVTANGSCVVCLMQTTVRYQKRNPEKVRLWALKKSPAQRAANVARARQWNREHPALLRHLGARRRAAEISRTPAWADMPKIRKMYEAARERTERTGEAWTVDHVIPLQGKYVSGLHVHENLQLLRGRENSSKSNKWNPFEM